MSRSIAIIGCGDSGALWDGQGDAIGVNDSWKHGRPTKYLLCVQTISQFKPYPPERLRTILESKPKKFYSHVSQWQPHFPDSFEKLEMFKWNPRKAQKGKIYFSKTSPFIAITMALAWGYDIITLYGVDFETHRVYSPIGDKNEFVFEITRYKELFEWVAKYGVKIEVKGNGILTRYA